ncbi:MAG: WecB/TagA/CpsF family glycosyltransferase [Pseudomonadota bacterium]
MKMIDPEPWNRTTYCIMGVPIDDIELETVVDEMRSAASERRSLFLSTANLNFLALSQQDREFKYSLRKSDLCLADGVAVVMIARLLGAEIRERVAGSDLIETLQATHDPEKKQQPIRTYIFGGTEGTAEIAKRVIAQDPRQGVLCVGQKYPGFGSVEEMSSDQTICDINDTNPDFVFVALGAQKGQAWIVRNRDALTAPIVSHLGATVNFIAGTVKRAPKRWQALGLEWAWRIRSEPNLARRYFDDSVLALNHLMFRGIPLIVWSWWNRKRRQGESLLTSWQCNPNDETLEIRLEGGGSVQNHSQFSAIVPVAVEQGKRVCLDASRVTWIDLRGMGQILLLWKALDDRGKALTIKGLSGFVRRSFFWNGLGDLID